MIPHGRRLCKLLSIAHGVEPPILILALALAACGSEVRPLDAASAGAQPGAGGAAGADAGSPGSGGAAGSGGAPPPTCSGASVVAGEILDPAEVYVIAASGSDHVLAHWSTPDTHVVDLYHLRPETVRIRPTDGRLLYATTMPETLREFHCDLSCLRTPDGGESWPPDAQENDPVLPTPGCYPSFEFLRFEVAPSGAVLYSCDTFEGKWADATGAFVYDGAAGPLLRLGHGELAITNTSIVHLDTGVIVPIDGLQDVDWLAVRAEAPDRFLVATSAVLDGFDDGEDDRLWRVGASGQVEQVGTYPGLPPGMSAYGGWLDGCDGLVQLGWKASAPSDGRIVRRTLAGASEVLLVEGVGMYFDNAPDALVSGP